MKQKKGKALTAEVGRAFSPEATLEKNRNPKKIDYKQKKNYK